MTINDSPTIMGKVLVVARLALVDLSGRLAR